jgi:hypothetical protein
MKTLKIKYQIWAAKRLADKLASRLASGYRAIITEG